LLGRSDSSFTDKSLFLRCPSLPEILADVPLALIFVDWDGEWHHFFDLVLVHELHISLAEVVPFTGTIFGELGLF